jgi:hypothetical protein
LQPGPGPIGPGPGPCCVLGSVSAASERPAGTTLSSIGAETDRRGVRCRGGSWAMAVVPNAIASAEAMAQRETPLVFKSKLFNGNSPVVKLDRVTLPLVRWSFGRSYEWSHFYSSFTTAAKPAFSLKPLAIRLRCTDLLTFVYHCFDRIVIQGYRCRPAQTDGRDRQDVAQSWFDLVRRHAGGFQMRGTM